METKRADVKHHLAELAAFACQLEAVYDRVVAATPAHEACGPGCGCASALGEDADANW